MNNFNLYRFIDKDGNILYIGRTNDINRRILQEHFTPDTHLPRECYIETEKVEYVTVENESEEIAYEAILINELRPKYNIQFKDSGKFDVKIPEFDWKEYEWEFKGQMEWMKKLKEDTISENDNVIKSLSSIFCKKIDTGFINIDNHMIIHETSLVLIAGISGMYKTNYALNIARRNSNNGNKVLFINIKDDISELTMRLLSMATNKNVLDIQKNVLTEKDYELITDSVQENKKNPIQFYNRIKLGSEIDSIIELIRKQAWDLVIIDDLSSIETTMNIYDSDKLAYVMKKLKATTIEYQIPIIAIYNLPKKKIDARPDKRPLITDIEYDSLISNSNIIQLTYNPDYYNDYDIEEENMLEVNTVKSTLHNPFVTRLCVLNCKLANFDQDA